VGSKKEKLVIVSIIGLLAVNLFQPSVLLAETIQPDIKTELNAAQTDINLPKQEDSAGLAVSRVESEIFYKMLLSIIAVITLGIGVIYVSKKVIPRFTNLPGKQIRVIETTHIAPRKGLHLVQVGARRLLIASTNENITMLADVTESAADFAEELTSRTKEEK
jgi:flagellar biosynthetic protein FliO